MKQETSGAEFFAHSRQGNPDHSSWQPLDVHLYQTASMAGHFAEPWNAADWAFLAGLWHDIGKYSDDFQAKIGAGGGENAHIESRAKVDHSTAGAQHANNVLPEQGYGKAIAYAIAGHHGGLPDGISEDACLRKRFDKQIPAYDKCPPEILTPQPLRFPFVITPQRAGTQISLFIRMLYSCLVDADFLDTEAFLDKERQMARRGYKTLEELKDSFFTNLDKLRAEAKSSLVNTEREKILKQCLRASSLPIGMFSLTVPTGGGKTLSSMAFALRHAVGQGLQRVIYVIPFTSIIEQNAAVFRSMLGDDAVLEHHSNFEPESEDRRSRLAAENWDAPIVVTTNVQFFESLFANRSSRCRKLHNIANSVIILDEVQTLPAPFLLPCIEALKELVAGYRTSIILCSATQPAIQKRSDFPGGIEGVREIIEQPQVLADTLKRTTIRTLGSIPDSEIVTAIKQHFQVLCVVSTRKHARTLFDEISSTEGGYHLTALMCPVHRSEVLQKIRLKLAEDQTCRVISTQLIEAGVDIDFPVVFRSLAGIDSIAQAAGRCNREGRLATGQVFVFEPESGLPAGHFRQTAQAAESVLRRHPQNVLSLAAIEDYFRQYYWSKGDALDEEGILPLLNAGRQDGDFPFKQIAERLKLIKSTMKPVVIPYDKEACRLISLMDRIEEPAYLSRAVQKYTVSIYPAEWSRLLTGGCAEVKAGLFPVLTDERLYSSEVGLCTDPAQSIKPDDLIV